MAAETIENKATATTELVVLNNNTAVEQYDEPDESEGDWDDLQIIPQYIQIKQALTEGMESVPLGHFYHRATGRHWKSLDVVVLKMHKTRQWKKSSPKFVADERPICRSNNGRTPVFAEGLTVQATKVKANNVAGFTQTCEVCPKNSWKGYNKDTGEGTKPLCEKGFFFLLIDKESKLPYIYTASGQSVTPSEAIQTAMFQVVCEKEAKLGRKLRPFEFTLKMTTEQAKKAYRVKFDELTIMTPENAAEFGSLFKQFAHAQAAPEPAASESELQTYVEEDEDTGAVTLDAESII